MNDVSAPGVHVQVVAAKLEGVWIIRAIGAFRTAESLQKELEPYTALFPADQVEWTQHRYRIPHYLVYGSGDLVGFGWPKAGVYLFRHGPGDRYSDAEMLKEFK